MGIAAAQLRVLLLRIDSADVGRFGSRHLVYGLLVTWAVGLGRYWDHPDPYLVQALGLGSPAALLALAGFLYAALLPLRIEGWRFFDLLTFLSLTALPGVLYAIPVERLMPLDTARSVNVWFLYTVALWRVLMLGRYLRARTSLSPLLLAAALILPLALIVVVLTLLNLEQAVFDVMSGLRETGTANDEAYRVMVLVTLLSFWSSPILALLYGVAVWKRWQRPVGR